MPKTQLIDLLEGDVSEKELKCDSYEIGGTDNFKPKHANEARMFTLEQIHGLFNMLLRRS